MSSPETRLDEALKQARLARADLVGDLQDGPTQESLDRAIDELLVTTGRLSLEPWNQEDE